MIVKYRNNRLNEGKKAKVAECGCKGGKCKESKQIIKSDALNDNEDKAKKTSKNECGCKGGKCNNECADKKSAKNVKNENIDLRTTHALFSKDEYANIYESIMSKVSREVKMALNEDDEFEDDELDMTKMMENADVYYDNWLERNSHNATVLAYLTAIRYGNEVNTVDELAFELAELCLNDMAIEEGRPYNDEVFIDSLKAYILDIDNTGYQLSKLLQANLG